MPRDRLDEYRHKRDFEATPEPAGEVDHGAGARRFVIQQHSATRLHWDLRLEEGGVLRSWAIPRGLPWDPKRNHLAVHTEDHPLEYLEFEGTIPEGSYGAGDMFVWDRGHYDVLSDKDGKLVIELHGARSSGRYALFRTGDERDWMIHRMDPPEDSERSWPPDGLRPMLATPGEVRRGDGWAWEVMLHGLRVMITTLPGEVRITDAECNDVAAAFPEIRRIGRATGSVEAILDGVVAGERAAIDKRLTSSASTVRKLRDTHPLRVVLFDIVWLDGHPIWDRRWDDRRAELEALQLDDAAWTTSAVHIGDGDALARAAADQGLAGLVGKRRASKYRCGDESAEWVRIDPATSV